ncbi:ABC transporter ATP-binding protein [Arthrobacter oryzae]|uniref:Energy-coupling factor transport system ATP-binding protein n=1 Tax=Arthrobacter oryzae TaxID=409290 RepID=A0A495EA73_9MICC|nr:ABC transporter ATP-binding protein [Arthrobacter oryzae]RKR13818.1 energy-coupling factor transport system ATP-binding protein [Arthrobacter oryzae]
MTAATRTALRASIGSFTFHGENRPALGSAALSVTPGALTAVLGGSGSGKSTLGKLLAGWLRAGHSGEFRGSLELDGTRLEFQGAPDDPRLNPAEWSRRVAYVPQDAAAMLSTVRATVAEELAFGLENRATPRAAMLRAVERTAARVGLSGLLDRDPATLSGGELRRLAVGCAVIAEPDILILDEPLASLDGAGAAQIEALIRGLCGAGTGVVLLSQAADRLAGEATHWTVLVGGVVTAEGTPAQLAGSAELERSGVLVPVVGGRGGEPDTGDRETGVLEGGAQKTGAQKDGVAAPGPGAGTHGAVAPVMAGLELNGVSFCYGGDSRRRVGPQPVLVLQNVNLTVRPGEIVAVTGANGTGKSTLLRHFNGLLRPAAGEVRVCGRNITGVPVGTVAASVGLLFQHPRDQLFERTVLRETLFGLRELFGKAGAEGKARAALAAVGLSAAAETVHPAELPSSQQRLLALATVLAREPAVLALDEPTVGLDRTGLEHLGRAVKAAAARGTAVVMVTHDLAYARATAHRILQLDAGNLREI